MNFPKIILKPGKDAATKRYHHWIFSGAISKIPDNIADGDVVSVFSHDQEFLGIGHYQQKGSISVRILSFTESNINSSFWREKLKNAIQLRRILGLPSGKTNCFRLIHGEGDGLPGLVIDYYDGVVVLLCYTRGMFNSRNDIAIALQELLKDRLRVIYYKTSGLPPEEELAEDPYLFGEKMKDILVNEHENKFLINWEEGQKSGFFLDQRENRQLVGEYSKGKSVLNTFCYSGGFSIYALQAGAKKVTSVDISEKAIDLTHQNVKINGFDDEKHEAVAADVLQFIKEHEEKYDIVILDPPAFAKHLSARHNAVQAYKRLNAQAFRNINPGGFLFTFSCSQVVDKVMFTNTVKSAAIEAGRPVKILKYLSQPEDHPVNIFHPETEYLKGLLLYVE